MDISAYTNELVIKDGIWQSKHDTSFSYSADGNSRCYEIEENSFWFRHRNNCILALLASFLPVENFLEIGGGNGIVAKAIQDSGIETILMEPGITGAQNALHRGIRHVISATLDEAGIRPKTIHAAGLFDVLEHIESEYDFLRSIHNILTDSGKLFLTVPAYTLIWSSDDAYAGHYRRYTLNGLQKALCRSGFHIEYATYFFSVLPLPIFLRRTVPSMLGFQKNREAQSKHMREHSIKSRFMENILNRIWDWELMRIHERKSIPFGSSCMAVATKQI